MKKILLSMIMLCTAMSAWSYKEETVTLSFSDHDASWKTTDNGSGIYVQATPYNNEETNNWWNVVGDYVLNLYAPQGYVVTGVKFAFISSETADNYCCIDQCDFLSFDSANETWVQKGGNFEYLETMTFKAYKQTFVESVTVTYHKHNLTHNKAVAATCVETGKKETWTCSDCKRTYFDNECTFEVPNENMLIQDIDPTNHPEALEEHAGVEPTCTTAGNMHYWHCSHCNKDFGNEGGTGEAITDVTIPAINHKNKKSTEAVAPTTETTGNVAYWYCPDCKKHFGDEGCTKELTEWILEKLMNMMHLDFAGTSVPIEAEHYLNTTKLNFTDGGDIILTVNGKSVAYDKGMIDKFTLSNGTPTAQISANEDPENTGTYYSTFYSSLESYAVPEGFTAYRGEISSDGTKLTLTSVGDDVMTRGEGYILKGTASSGNMNVTANAGSSSDNVLQGTDVAIASLGANDYALSHGSNGVGFYLWSGKNIGANKAYLELPASSVKAFTFEFEEATGIHNSQFIIHNSENDEMYNLNGVRVDENYKGIVIKNGKKVYQR